MENAFSARRTTFDYEMTRVGMAALAKSSPQKCLTQVVGRGLASTPRDAVGVDIQTRRINIDK